MDLSNIWSFLKPALNIAAEQIPGIVIALATSFYVAQVYFKRQRKIDEMKEKKEVELAHTKLINAYIASGGFRPKNGSFQTFEAMSELRTKLEVYRADFDAQKWLEDAADDAVKFVADHNDDFEKIPEEHRN
jgi:hypothetical protein